MIRSPFALLAFLIWAMPFLAQAQKYSNEFLSIGVGARAQAMGGAQTALVDDATAGFWNPAGLTRVRSDLQVAAMHAEWFGGIGKYDHASFAMPLEDGKHYIGATFIRFGVDGIPNTLSLYEADGTINYDNVTEFTAADYAMMFTYAKELGETGISLGGNAKVIHRKIGPFATSWGFGLDFGAQYRVKNWQFGLMLQDVTSTFNAWSFNFTDAEKEVLDLTNNEVPIQSLEITRPQIRLGTAYHKRFNLVKKDSTGVPLNSNKERSVGLTLALDMNVTTDGRRNTLIRSNPFSIDPVLGMELDYNRLVFLRAGMNNAQQFLNDTGESVWTVQPNIGAGFQIYKLRVDYALTNLGGSSGALYSHVISLKFDIPFEYIKRAVKEES